MSSVLERTRLQGLKSAASATVAQLRKPRLTLSEQILLARRLAFFSQAGVPLMEALIVIKAQTRSRAKGLLYSELVEDVANGKTFSASLERLQHVFMPFAVDLIRVGETSGILTENLSYLADELTKRKELRSKILGALLYPALITLATLGVTVMLTAYIFPKILPIFTSLNVPLPVTTRALVALSSFLQSYGILVLVLFAVFCIGTVILCRRSITVRSWCDTAVLRMPLIAGMLRAYHLATASRTLGLMLRSGIPLTSAAALVAQTCANTLYARAYADAVETLLRGETMSKSLSKYPNLFDDTFIHMLEVGQTTGSLSKTLLHLAGLYEADLDERTKHLSVAIEPVLMLVMGLIVGLIAVSVIAPIYAITQHLSPR